MASTRSKDSPTPEDFGVLLNLAFGAFKQELHAVLAKAGFDDFGPSFGYVFRLLAKDSLNLRDVAAALGMTAPGALKIVNDMVDKGYIERRENSQDARQRLLTLTVRARQAMAAAHKFHVEFERSLSRQLGEAQASSARVALETIVNNAEEKSGQKRLALRPL